MATFPLTNLEDMKTYIEEKFSGEVYSAEARTSDEFGEVVKWTIDWTPRGDRGHSETGTIWCRPNGLTAAVPMKP